MSINKFYPTSPDLNITTDSDMTLAKFGHLNRLVEDINAGGGGGGGSSIIIEGEGADSTIRCGVDNQSFGQYGSALSGFNNITCNDFTANTWGRNNIAHGCYSSVSGTSNIVCARQSHILSGTNNTIACDATQGALSTQSSYSGNYIYNITLPDGGGISCGRINYPNCDLTSVWTAGSTFSVTYSYAYGITGTGSAYSQFQMANVPVICSEYVAPYTYLYFCYDPTSPSFVGAYRCEFGTGSTYSQGYLQKTGTFSSYSTYGSTYHPNTIAGGAFNTITGYTSGATISGGYQNTISNGYASLVGGNYNYIHNSYYSLLGAGYGNVIQTSLSVFIGVGSNNCICSNSARSGIVSGFQNVIICNSTNSIIGAGQYNNISSSNNSSILGGSANFINTSNQSIIGGGGNNTISTYSCYSAILGGQSNTISNFACTFIVGSNITADRCCATFVNNLSIKNIPTSDAGLPTKSVWFDATTCTLKMVP
jgi:hypothetical protein